MLEDIAKACHTCMNTSNAPRLFTVRFPDEVIFNRIVFMDLMFLEDRRPVLHVVDAGPKFQAAMWLTGEDVASVWNSFVLCWSRLFLGDPEIIMSDAGSVSNAEEFCDICFEHGITLRSSGIE
jgi:hypothetical protein